jgi:dynactin complex subunit
MSNNNAEKFGQLDKLMAENTILRKRVEELEKLLCGVSELIKSGAPYQALLAIDNHKGGR